MVQKDASFQSMTAETIFFYLINISSISVFSLMLIPQPVCPSYNLKACGPGFFGAGCEQTCDCPGGGSCDPTTGACSQRCPAGFHGDRCKLSMIKRYIKTDLKKFLPAKDKTNIQKLDLRQLDNAVKAHSS